MSNFLKQSHCHSLKTSSYLYPTFHKRISCLFFCYDIYTGKFICFVELSFNYILGEVESPKPEPMPPIFTRPLLSQLVPEGEPVKMEVEVLACPEATFTWTFKKKPIKSSRDFHITSENNKSVLLISEAFGDDSGAYTCKAQNEVGTATTTATLTIESKILITVFEFYMDIHHY